MGLDAHVGKLDDYDEDEEEGRYLVTWTINRITNILHDEFGYNYEEKEGRRFSFRIGDYAALHFLRRLAMTTQGFDVDTYEKEKDFYHKLFTGEISEIKYGHLIRHEDNEGYYFPVDFGDRGTLWEDVHLTVLSNTSIGSSINLKRELLELLPHVPRKSYEMTIWIKLYRLAVESIRSDRPIIFC